MSKDEIFEVTEDSQILEETALNERVVDHPQFGSVKFSMPTLKIQRKINAMARTKKKMLLHAYDEVEDPDKPGEMKRVPAYQSREVLAKEYKKSGWWTDEHEERLEKMSTEHVAHLAELEVLGFISVDSCIQELQNIRDDLYVIFEKDGEEGAITDEVSNAVVAVTGVMETFPTDAEKILRQEAPSTEVDDLLEEALRQRRIYSKYLELHTTYTDLVALQQEQNSLFSDSWQDQLSYFVRLAQVHYCVQNADTGNPLWPTLDDMEMEPNSDLIRWVFDELTAFWQGLTEEMREKLGKYDFIYGRSERQPSSADSPVLPESKTDGEPQENEQISFSEGMDTKET